MIANLDMPTGLFLFDMALVVIAVILQAIAWTLFRKPGADFVQDTGTPLESILTPTGLVIAKSARITGIIALVLGFGYMAWRDN